MTPIAEMSSSELVSATLDRLYLNQRELSVALGCTQVSISRWLNGGPMARSWRKKIEDMYTNALAPVDGDQNAQLNKLIEEIKRLSKCKTVTLSW